jgi:hypothetical protein
MNTGVEIVNALFEHLGMAVSVTAETISEWWPILVSKWAAFEIGTSCVWLALGLVLVIGAIIALAKMAHAYTHYQDSKLDYDEIGVICFVALCAMAIGLIICQALDIVTAITFPEKLIFDYVTNMLD